MPSFPGRLQDGERWSRGGKLRPDAGEDSTPGTSTWKPVRGCTAGAGGVAREGTAGRVLLAGRQAGDLEVAWP